MYPSQNLPVAREILSGTELQEDRRILGHLLNGFVEMETQFARRDALRLALDLFETHAALEAKLNLRRDDDALYAAITGMMEQQELTDPLGRLYMARGLELKSALEAYMLKEKASHALVCESAALDPEALSLLQRRGSLVGAAARMLAACGSHN